MRVRGAIDAQGVSPSSQLQWYVLCDWCAQPTSSPRMALGRTTALLLASGFLVSGSFPTPLVGQQARCDGARIVAIDITPGRPPFSGAARKWQVAARAIGLHHATTDPEVLRAFLQLREGGLCTQERISESERVLRGLPFIADAHVVAERLPGNQVRIQVQTVDEVPVLAAGSIRRGTPSALALGNANLGGDGLRLFAGVTRGFVYRNGGFVQLSKYELFGAPVIGAAEAARGPIDSHVSMGVSWPFLSNLQHGSWQAAFRAGDDFPTVSRADSDDLALQVHSQRWSVSGTARSHIGGLITLAGPAIIGVHSRPASTPVFVTDSGLVSFPTAVYQQRYANINTVRAGALGGVRRINYRTVTGFDALFASQDVLNGVEVGLLAAGGPFNQHGDFLGAGAMYAGRSGERWLAATEIEAEARRDFVMHDWTSTIASGRAAAYYKFGEPWLLELNNEYSSIVESLIPAALAIGDPVGGVRGYAGARVSGATRDVSRIELRWARRDVFKRGDAGISIFSDAGRLRAGDVPFGENTTAQSVGVSLLAAFPSKSKRVYRLSLAVPLRRGLGASGVEVRFVSGDPTATFWTEPGDVTQARLAPVPSTLFSWPTVGAGRPDR